jgi:hypothetical protein
LINSKGENLVFLLSLPRSGSTLLSLMLGNHPAICCPPEPWIVLALAEYLDLGNVKSVPYDRELAEIASIEFLLNPERKQRGTLSRVLNVIGQISDLNAVEIARQILLTAYQGHLDISGKSVFVDKTPRYYTVLGLIDEIFPQAKKIVLLRNPLDIFASYRNRWGIPKSIFTPEGVSAHTRDFCEGLFTLADYTTAAKDNVFILHYEDLVSDPESALRPLCEFVDIGFLPAMLAYYKNTELMEEFRRSPVGDPVASDQFNPLNSETVNAWRKRLEETDIQALIGVLGINIFKRLGYFDTVTKLRDMSLNIPTETQANESRNTLMRTLVENVHERHILIWSKFISYLKLSPSDSESDIAMLKQQLSYANAPLDPMHSSKFWRFTKPICFIRRSLSIKNHYQSIKNVITSKVYTGWRITRKLLDRTKRSIVDWDG